MKRIINHWTGGPGRATALDKKHYHLMVEHDGTIVEGTEAIEDNIVTSDGDYAAHTLMLNTESIGVAVCGMNGAQESPFEAGQFPINEDQFRKLAALNANLCLDYDIPVTPQTVLTHAEVETNLGVKQRGKWDITRLPWDESIRGARPVGDYFRKMVMEFMGVVHKNEVEEVGRPTLRIGNKHRDPFVVVAQELLATRGYFLGAKDGLFGTRTRASVLAFQADNGLNTDGIIGAKTWEALTYAEETRPERDVTLQDLKDRGSRTIETAETGKKMATTLSVGGATAWIVDNATTLAPTLDSADGVLAKLQHLVSQYWIILLIAAAGVAAWYFFNRIEKYRLEDAKSGANTKI